MAIAIMTLGLSSMTNALSPGDIAIIGYRCDDINGIANDGNDDAFAWLPLTDLPGGHVIYFTDDGWTAAGDFRAVEGGIKYTVPSGGLSAGTVMLLEYSRNSSSPGIHTFLPDPNLGVYASYNDAEIGTLGFEISAAGDNIFVFDGSTTSPNFIYGVKTEDGFWDADSTSNDSSALPAALTDGVTAVAFGGIGNANFDNARYTGTTSGTKDQLLDQISHPGNWDTSETDNFGGDITNGTGSSGGGDDFTVIPRISISDVALAEGNGIITNFIFTVSLDVASAGTVTVDYATGDSSATKADGDYKGIGITKLTFPPGVKSKSLTVQVNGDTKVELNEIFFVNLSNPIGGKISDSQGRGTIANDDTATLSINDVTLNEGNSGTTPFIFTVTLSTAVDVGVSMGFATANGTATTADNDYTGISITKLSFTGKAGETQTITVNVIGDKKLEKDETFFVNLSNIQAGGRKVVFADAQGLGTILNELLNAVDDSYETQQDTKLTVNAPGVLENDTGDGVISVIGFDAISQFGGNVLINNNGSFSYKPSSGFVGYDTFGYTASDGGSGYDTGTVTIEVKEKNVWKLISLSGNKCFYQGTAPDQPSCVELVNVEDLGFDSLSEWFSSVVSPNNKWLMVIGVNGAMDISLPPAFHSLKYMSPINGYWVKVAPGGGELCIKDDDFNTDCAIGLIEGWNLLGYPSKIGYYDTATHPDLPGNIQWVQVAPPVAAHVLKSIAGKYTMVIGEYGAYDPSLPPVFSSLHYIVPCMGFWVKMDTTGSLIYSQAGPID